MIVSEFIAVSQCFLCGIDDGNSKSEMDCQRASIIFWYYSLFGGLEVYKQISFFRFCMCDFICIFEKLNENFQNDKKVRQTRQTSNSKLNQKRQKASNFFFHFVWYEFYLLADWFLYCCCLLGCVKKEKSFCYCVKKEENTDSFYLSYTNTIP